MAKRGGKYCPKCGAGNDISDAYCIRCGYSFRRKGKKLNIKIIIILVIILLVAWAVMRFFLNESIIPEELIDILKNITGNRTG